MKKHLPGWAVLLIITLAAGLALGGTYALTQEPIAQQAVLAADNARKAALPNADSFEELTLNEGASVDWAYAGLKDGNAVGYVAQKTVNGFGGKVEVIAGVDTTGAPDTFTIGGISVGGSSFSETAGLGARSKEPAFTNQFAGKVYPVSYIKAGGTATESTVDALTSATITTTAVVNGVNDIVKYIKADVMGIAGVEMPAKPADGVFSASEKGFRGPVYVEAAFDGAGKVTYIKVGDESFAEDIGVGVIEPDFMIQFIGKAMPLEVADIDVIAGATISSTAVVKALNNAYAIAGGAEIVVPETYLGVGDDQFAETEGFGARALEAEEQYPFIGKQMPLEIGDVDALTGATFTKTAIVNGLNKAYAASKGEVEAPAAKEAPAENKAAPENAVTASAQGFGGPVAVTAAFDADGKITYIKIGDDSFSETAGLGAKALEDSFQAQFIGKAMPLKLSDIDAIAGATVTSTAVVDALNAAYEKTQDGAKAEPAPTAAPAPAAAPEIIGGADEPTAIILPAPVSSDGLSTGEVICFFTAVKVEAQFADGKVAALNVSDKQIGSDQDFAPSTQQEAMQALFVGAALPVDNNQATPYASAVAIALNQAFGQPGQAPAAILPAAAGSDGWYTGEVICFFTAVKAEAQFTDGKVAALNVFDKQIGSDQDFAPSAQQEAMQALFVGAALPVDNNQATPYASAVAVALNQAFGQTGRTAAAVSAEPFALASGSSIMFFTQYFAEAAFDGSVLVNYDFIDFAGAEKLENAVYVEDPALRSALIGQKMPLNPNDFTSSIGGVPAYVVNALVIALNDAYNQTAGQQ